MQTKFDDVSVSSSCFIDQKDTSSMKESILRKFFRTSFLLSFPISTHLCSHWPDSLFVNPPKWCCLLDYGFRLFPNRKIVVCVSMFSRWLGVSIVPMLVLALMLGQVWTSFMGSCRCFKRDGAQQGPTQSHKGEYKFFMEGPILIDRRWWKESIFY